MEQNYVTVTLCIAYWVVDLTMYNVSDVDECTLGSHNCGRSQRCENTDGSFTCADLCQPGYTAANNASCIGLSVCVCLYFCYRKIFLRPPLHCPVGEILGYLSLWSLPNPILTELDF